MSLQTKRRPFTASDPSAFNPDATSSASGPGPPTATADNARRSGRSRSRSYSLAARGPSESHPPRSTPPPLQRVVRQAPGHEPFDRAIDRLPTDLEDFRRLPPTQPPRPTGQKAHHRRGQPALALVPGNLFDHYPVLGTFHSPRCVVKPNSDVPQRHMPPGPLSQFVVARCRALALRAPSRHPLVGSHADFNSLRLAMPSVKPNVSKNKSGMGLNLVQNRFNVQLNGWSPGSRFLCCSHHRLTQTMETRFFSQPRFVRRRPCASFACCRRSFSPSSTAKIYPRIVL